MPPGCWDPNLREHLLKVVRLSNPHYITVWCAFSFQILIFALPKICHSGNSRNHPNNDTWLSSSPHINHLHNHRAVYLAWPVISLGRGALPRSMSPMISLKIKLCVCSVLYPDSGSVVRKTWKKRWSSRCSCPPPPPLPPPPCPSGHWTTLATVLVSVAVETSVLPG